MGTSAASPSSWSQSSALATKLRAWAADPVLFAREALGLELWSKQAEIARAVVDHDYVSVRSGHKVGKSTLDAAIALWAATMHPDWRVVFTAPASHQVEHILWPELRRLYLAARVPLGGRLYQDPHKGLFFREGWEIFGLTTDKPERFAGISSRGKLVFIVDEASGFPEPIFQAVFGNMAGGAKVILTSNPTRTYGTFYDSFHSKRASWTTFAISSLETPNCTGQGPRVPGLATPEWVEWAKKHWGGGKLEGPIIDVRVKGNFPEQAQNAVIALALVEEARERWASEPEPDDLLNIGVDVARYGDDETVLYPRRGRKALPPRVLRSQDTNEVAAAVVQMVRDLRRDKEEIPRAKIDTCGGWGAGVYDQLKHCEELEAIGVNVAEAATDESYAKLRDQVWFAVRDFLAEGGALPEDPELEVELVAPTYTFNAQGKQKVAAKEEIKAAIGRSPDRADALGLSVYNPPVVTGSSARARGRWSR